MSSQRIGPSPPAIRKTVYASIPMPSGPPSRPSASARRYQDGSIAVPTQPGLGVKLNREKLRQYSELYQRLGGYPYDQDPGRPGWTPIVPNDRWADPKDDRPVRIPC